MPALKTVNCPSCAGDIAFDGDSERVTCRYCGTTSFVQQGARRAPANVPVIVVGPRVTSLIALALGLAAALLGLGVTLFVALRPSAPAPTPQPPKLALAPAPAPVPAESKAPEPPPVPVIRVLSDTPTLFSDLDGDQHADAIAPISVTLAAARSEHYAVFAGPSAKELARTPALPERRSALVALLERRLLIAQHDGQLRAYDLGSGDLQWSSALGERVVALCKGPAGTAHVTTDADRRIHLDLVTGRQTPAREACSTLLARAESARDPRDRRDHTAPLDVDSYSCGGVRVMGDQNYAVPDACRARAHVDSDRLDGMVGHRLWRQGSDWLVFGVRKPGAYVPMVGRLRRGRFVWKSEVPAQNPLDAQEGGPRFTALAGDQLTLAYQSGRPARWWLTAFGAQDGVRRWTRELPAELQGLHTLGAADDRVFVQAGEALLFLDAAQGEQKASVGSDPAR